MPRAHALPEGLDNSFSIADATALGISRHALRRHALHRPHSGIRSFVPAPRDDLLALCVEFAPRLRPWQFFSHETALLLLGTPGPSLPYRAGLHVAAHRPAREPRLPNVIGHRLQTRDPLVIADHGLPIEHPVRAWRQAGSTWSTDDLIAAGDFLISGSRPLATIEELREEVEVMGDVTGGRLRRALREMRVGVRSPRETRVRLLIVRAGLPEPEVNWTLRDANGHFVAELDLAYPAWRVAPEYDGRVHAEDARQFAKDADRWDRIRAAGWDHVRVLNHHLGNGGAVAVRKVRDALLRAGWRPGTA